MWQVDRLWFGRDQKKGKSFWSTVILNGVECHSWVACEAWECWIKYLQFIERRKIRTKRDVGVGKGLFSAKCIQHWVLVFPTFSLPHAYLFSVNDSVLPSPLWFILRLHFFPLNSKSIMSCLPSSSDHNVSYLFVFQVSLLYSPLFLHCICI